MLIIIGDIHGCYDELRDLLDRIGPSRDDAIISVGDLVDRGPRSLEVVRFFRSTPGTRAILGNHEDKHLRSARDELRPALSQIVCREQAGDSYQDLLDYFAELPLHLDLDEALIVHAGYEPDLSIAEQPRNVLLRCKWPGDRGFGSGPMSWVTRYQGERPVVYGHSVSEEPRIVGRTFGIDTGACHGGKLTALLLPSERIVSVQARADYWTREKLDRRGKFGRPNDELIASAEASLKKLLTAFPSPEGAGGRRALGLALSSHPLAKELTSLAFARDRRKRMLELFPKADVLSDAAARWEKASGEIAGSAHE
jgi:hypothetical protein